MNGHPFAQVQSITQTQRQHFSQKQIYSLHILALNNKEMQTEIQNAANENPVLEIKRYIPSYDNTHTSTVTKAQEELSEKYTKAFEENESAKETLQEHLLSQLNMINLLEDEYAIGKALIQNLDKNGYHIFAPVSLLDSSRPLQTKTMLKKMLKTIQHFDPEGTCCTNMEESLYIQAKTRRNVPPLALFILNGNIEVLYSTKESPDFSDIQKKLIELQSKKNFLLSEQDKKNILSITIQDVKDAISFISRLNPNPASEFKQEHTQYVYADIKIEKCNGNIPLEKEDNTEIVKIDDSSYFKITLTPEAFPFVQINQSFRTSRNREIKKNITKAERLIKALEYRKNFLLQTCKKIVQTQKKFFLTNGAHYLDELLQTELAKEYSVNKSTISRVANEKYIQSPWGQLYPIKFFFTTQQDKIKHYIKKIIKENETRRKPFSDQELTKELSKIGIKTSRRSVALYRKELDIESSFKRNMP